MTVTPAAPRRRARAARGEIEAALDLVAWPWSARLSLGIDALLVIEEEEG